MCLCAGSGWSESRCGLLLTVAQRSRYSHWLQKVWWGSYVRFTHNHSLVIHTEPITSWLSVLDLSSFFYVTFFTSEWKQKRETTCSVLIIHSVRFLRKSSSLSWFWTIWEKARNRRTGKHTCREQTFWTWSWRISWYEKHVPKKQVSQSAHDV